MGTATAKLGVGDASGHDSNNGIVPIGDVRGAAASWYAVRTRSRGEKVVARELAARWVEHYLPLVSRRKRWSDRYVTLQEPLFPGYVLVRIEYRDYDQRVSVLQSAGVVGFVGSRDMAWPVPETEVCSVRAMVQSGLSCSPYPHLKEGDHVRVIHGPMQGATGILVCGPRNHRLVVSIHLFAQSISVEVDIADVQPLDA